MTWAPPAMPASRAIQPASRPMTSTTMMRWCDSAVVWILSTASVAVVTRSVEAECDFGGRKIVVDGLGNAHDLHALVEKFERDGLRALAADADHRIDAQLAGVGDDFIGNIANDFFAVFDGAVFERIAAIGGAQDGAAARQNAADVLEREFVGFLRPDQAVEAVRDADDLPLVFQEWRT